VPDDDSLVAAHCAVCVKPMLCRPLAVITKMEERAERLSAHVFTSKTVLSPLKEPFIVLAEDIRSLWNVGSIFRTADGVGVSRLVLCGITGNPPRKEIAKTSLGAEDTIPWNYVPSALDALLPLKKLGYQIVGLERNQSSKSLSELLSASQIKIPFCLIVGNEVTGLSPEVVQHCDIVTHLPMRGMKESLNVAVAFGIAAYAITERIDAQALCPTRI